MLIWVALRRVVVQLIAGKGIFHWPIHLNSCLECSLMILVNRSMMESLQRVPWQLFMRFICRSLSTLGSIHPVYSHLSLVKVPMDWDSHRPDSSNAGIQWLTGSAWLSLQPGSHLFRSVAQSYRRASPQRSILKWKRSYCHPPYNHRSELYLDAPLRSTLRD